MGKVIITADTNSYLTFAKVFPEARTLIESTMDVQVQHHEDAVQIRQTEPHVDDDSEYADDASAYADEPSVPRESVRVDIEGCVSNIIMVLAGKDSAKYRALEHRLRPFVKQFIETGTFTQDFRIRGMPELVAYSQGDNTVERQSEVMF